jgi:hypothetical protein
MKRFISNRFAFCIAAFVFSGCASQPSSMPLRGTTLQPNSSAVFSGETFAATEVRAVCQPIFGGYSVKFGTKGVASGPFPGKFTAHGYDTITLGGNSGFYEMFKVTSGSRIVSGVASTPFPGTLHCNTPYIQVEASYALHGSGSGQTSATVEPHDFSQLFH